MTPDMHQYLVNLAVGLAVIGLLVGCIVVYTSRAGKE